MAYIEIYNDDNTVLIDDQALNHRMVQRGTATSAAGFAMPNLVSATRSLNLATESMPIVAWAPRTAGIYSSLHGITETASGSGVYEWQYACGPSTSPIVFDYYMFQDGLSDPMAGTGLVVCRNAQNVVVFDSDEDYAQIVDIVTVPLDATITKTYTNGRKYAVCNSNPLVRRTSSGPGGGWVNVYPIGASISSNTITFAPYRARDTQNTGTRGDTVGNDVAATFMVFDVTGL